LRRAAQQERCGAEARARRRGCGVSRRRRLALVPRSAPRITLRRRAALPAPSRSGACARRRRAACGAVLAPEQLVSTASFRALSPHCGPWRPVGAELHARRRLGGVQQAESESAARAGRSAGQHRFVCLPRGSHSRCQLCSSSAGDCRSEAWRSDHPQLRGFINRRCGRHLRIVPRDEAARD
jgi:hypothetical protein